MTETPATEARSGPGESLGPSPLVDAIGAWVIEWCRSLGDKLDFLGATITSIARLAVGRAPLHRLRFTEALQEAGVETLPIVALIALASGGVLMLLATQQLDKLGAGPLAPRIVAIVILRELAALTTGIALAGRVGSSLAADLAAMVARGELDAARREGRDLVELLVAPRVLALALMGPLLVTYASVLGLSGAALVGAGATGASVEQHVPSLLSALSLTHSIAGLAKGAAYGCVVGLSGCYYGLRSAARGLDSVGPSVRRAVVSAVVGVVLADTVLTLVFKWVRL